MSFTVVQSKVETPGITGVSIAVALDSVATSGNLLASWVAYDKNAGTITGPSGWSTPILIKGGSSVTLAFSWKESDGTEQSVTWLNSTNRGAVAKITEISGFDTPVLDVSAVSVDSNTAVTSRSTGTTTTTTAAETFAIALMGVDSYTNVNTGRAWTNSFTEEEFGFNTVSGLPGFSEAHKTLSATGIVESTFSTTGGGDQMAALVAVFKGASAPGAGIVVFRRRINGDA